MICIYDCLCPCCIFVLFFYYNLKYKVILDIFVRKCCRSIDSCIVYNTSCNCYIIKISHCSRDCHTVHLCKLNVMWVLSDIILCYCGWICILIQFDPADLLKHQITPCCVRCIVWNCHFCTVRNIIDRIIFLRIYTCRHCRDQADCYQISVITLVEIFHVSCMLLNVNINISVI